MSKRRENSLKECNSLINQLEISASVQESLVAPSCFFKKFFILDNLSPCSGWRVVLILIESEGPCCCATSWLFIQPPRTLNLGQKCDP